jgi:hypothetical protein
MSDETQDVPERSPRGWGWGWVLWPPAVLLCYVLSTGPALMMIEKKLIREDTLGEAIVIVFYRPLEWATDCLGLGRPGRMYLHLWAPGRFDDIGERINN